MLIAEELLLLLAGRACGELPRRGGTQLTLAAAVLVEVAAKGRLAIDPPNVSVRDAAPLGDPVLDAVRAPGTVADLLNATTPGLYRRLLDRLTDRGVLTRSTRWWTFGLVSRTVWRPTDPAPHDDLQESVRAVLRGRSEPDVRTGALITLLYAMDALEKALGRLGDEELDRAEEIAAGDWADEVTKAVIAASKDTDGQWGPVDDVATDAVG